MACISSQASPLYGEGFFSFSGKSSKRNGAHSNHDYLIYSPSLNGFPC
jgi:hypothetical protein